ASQMQDQAAIRGGSDPESETNRDMCGSTRAAPFPASPRCSSSHAEKNSCPAATRWGPAPFLTASTLVSRKWPLASGKQKPGAATAAESFSFGRILDSSPKHATKFLSPSPAHADIDAQ